MTQKTSLNDIANSNMNQPNLPASPMDMSNILKLQEVPQTFTPSAPSANQPNNLGAINFTVPRSSGMQTMDSLPLLNNQAIHPQVANIIGQLKQAYGDRQPSREEMPNILAQIMSFVKAAPGGIQNVGTAGAPMFAPQTSMGGQMQNLAQNFQIGQQIAQRKDFIDSVHTIMGSPDTTEKKMQNLQALKLSHGGNDYGLGLDDIIKQSTDLMKATDSPDTKTGVPINESEIDSKAQSVLDGNMAPSQLPKFGGAASIFNKVTAKVLEKDPNFDFSQAEADYGAGKSSLAQIKKQKTLTSSFERTAQKNLSVLETTADKYTGRNGSPALNKLKQAWESEVVSDPDLAAAKTALVTFTNEYAKIMTGQTGGAGVSDSARREAADLIKLTDSPKAFKARINVMRQDMANRMSGFDEEINSIRGVKNGGETKGTELLNYDGQAAQQPNVEAMRTKYNQLRESGKSAAEAKKILGL